MIRSFALLLLLVLTASAAEKNGSPVVTGNKSLRLEITRSMSRGSDWLITNQHASGYWSTPDYPAVTALALVALKAEEGASPKKTEALNRGFAFLRAAVKPDGSIYAKKELINYNTSLSLLAFSALNDPKDAEIIKNARAYITRTQVDFDTRGVQDSVFDGGIGYGSRYEHSDLSNTLAALEALHYSAKLQTDTATDAPKLDFAAAIQFLQNCQHLPGTNKQSWVSADAANNGGFIYHPAESKAGETNLPSGKVALRAYGSISYAGMLSYIYAGLEKDDSRVTAVLDWLEQHYTLEENPGMGQQGLFFYYHTMAKALHTAGVEKLEVAGSKVDWREKLGLRLLNLQAQDGSWANTNARWWEKDPALVTAYGVITLKFVSADL